MPAVSRAIDPAPDFRGTYPSAGERIGPAWQAAWEDLADRQWVKGTDFAWKLAERVGLAPATIRGLLRQAAAASVLEVELRFAGKLDGYRRGSKVVRAAWYRRPA